MRSALSSRFAAYFLFILVGIANAGWILSDLALVLEFAPVGRRPTYMGVARGLLGPWIGLAPILGGILLGQFGYNMMIATSTVLTIAGVLLISTRVRDPRWLHAQHKAPALQRASATEK